MPTDKIDYVPKDNSIKILLTINTIQIVIITMIIILVIRIYAILLNLDDTINKK